MEQGSRTAGFSRGKVFRPLLCWFVLSVVLLAWRYHQQQERQATIQFTVSMEGRKERPFYHAELNQNRFDTGEHSGLGRKELTIRADDAEPFATNVFVWYGGKNLGHITLARSRGTLDLKLVPAAERVGVSGQETNYHLGTTTQQSLSLPTGKYKVAARFARFTTERDVEILRQQTQRLVIDPGITTLALSSNPTNAEFELNSVQYSAISERSNTPAIIPDLPAGEYRLRIWRGDYQQTLPVKLAAGQSTNTLKVEFDYARLTISSEPPGAEIREGEKVLGTTPADLTLPVGPYQLAVAKQGFYSTNLSLTLRPNEQPQVTVSLLSVAYAQAMEQARKHLSGFSADFDRALEQVNKALQIRPNDEAALALKQTATFRRYLHEAREFQRQRQFAKALGEIDSALKLKSTDADALALKQELETQHQSVLQTKAQARRELPRKIFEEAVGRIQHHDLFPSEQMQCKGEAATISSKLITTLSRNPSWNIQRHDNANPDVAIIQADIKGFGSRQSVLLVVGQTAEDEVTIHFKLWIYTLGNNIQIGLTTGISEDSYKPLHASYASQAVMPNVERRRAREFDDFKKRIKDGLP